MRVFFGLCAVMAACGLAGAAAAQTAKPDPFQCAVAYSAVAKEKGRVQAAGLNKQNTDSLVQFIDNISSISQAELDRRAKALEPQIKAASPGQSAFGAALQSVEVAKGMMVDGMFASSSAVLAPTEVYKGQREIFARARACDQAYGFSPVMGAAPSHEAVLAHYRTRSRGQIDQRQAELAGLDDQKCAVRFWALGTAAGSDRADLQQITMRKLALAASKAMAAQPSLTQARLSEMVKADGMKRLSTMKGPQDLPLLLEEVNACERRYGMTLTKADGGQAPAK